MNDQKRESKERKNQNRNSTSKNQEKKTLIDKMKLDFTKEKPAKDTLKKYYNGII